LQKKQAVQRLIAADQVTDVCTHMLRSVLLLRLSKVTDTLGQASKLAGREDN